MSLKRLIEEWPDVPVSECRGCKKKIVWAETQDGKKIPLDAGPPTYLLMRHEDTMTGRWVYRCDQEKMSFVSHFATCPNANDFSGSKK